MHLLICICEAKPWWWWIRNLLFYTLKKKDHWRKTKFYPKIIIIPCFPFKVYTRLKLFLTAFSPQFSGSPPGPDFSPVTYPPVSLHCNGDPQLPSCSTGFCGYLESNKRTSIPLWQKKKSCSQLPSGKKKPNQQPTIWCNPCLKAIHLQKASIVRVAWKFAATCSRAESYLPSFHPWKHLRQKNSQCRLFWLAKAHHSFQQLKIGKFNVPHAFCW